MQEKEVEPLTDIYLPDSLIVLGTYLIEVEWMTCWKFSFNTKFEWMFPNLAKNDTPQPSYVLGQSMRLTFEDRVK